MYNMEGMTALIVLYPTSFNNNYLAKCSFPNGRMMMLMLIVFPVS